MRTQQNLCAIVVAVAALCGVQRINAQSTAFTYQGQLNDGGNPANGSYDLTFALFDASSAGNQFGTVLTNAATTVSNALFTVTLDFGNQFPGADRWLEIGVATNGGSGFVTLAPRQQITATPYAMQAANAGTAATALTAGSANAVNASNILGALTIGQLPAGLVTNGASGVTLAGLFGGDGSGLSNIFAGSITGVLSAAQIPGLDGSNITSGTIAIARLPSSLVTNGASGVTFAGTFNGNGAGLTNVDLVTVNSRGSIVWVPKPSGVFTLSSSPVVGNAPRSVITADVNGDGKLDLISANSGVNTLSVLTNNGSGGLVLAGTYGVGTTPYSVTAADVNGDGKLDLICANVNSSSLSVLTNNGSGGFAFAASLSVGFGPFSVIAADVNGDGKPDLISANNGSATLSVLTNNGSGGFVLASSPGVATGPVSVTAADVNGDGKLDLVCANNGSATLSVLTNNGSGGFALAASLGVGFSPLSVAATDVNGDGKVDLISANSGANTLTVLTNNGSGGFAVASVPAVGSGPQSVIATDVNGDGKVDLICANANSSTLSVLTNNGSGGFVLTGSPTVGATPVSVTAGDLNGDGAVDLISANISASTLTVLLNTVTNLAPVFQNLNASNLTSGTIPDARLSSNVPLLNGGTDRFSGVVVATNSGNQFSGNGAGLNGVDLRTVNSAGALSWSTNSLFQLGFSPAVGTAPWCVVAADINGNGSLDLITANSSDNTLSILNNNGSGTFTLSGTVSVGTLPRSVAAADVNGDGKTDLIAANYNVNTLSVLTNNGSGGFALSSTLTVGSGPRTVIAADVNGDGKLDLISANNIANTLTVLTNNGVGGFVLASTLSVGSAPYTVTAADVNSDGKLDLISANNIANTLTVLTNNGSGGFVLASSPTVGTAPISVTAADVNGDGRPDLISANNGSANLTVLFNLGNGTFTPSSSPGVGSGPYSVAAADLNGDGKMDLVCANNGVNTLSVLTNNGSGGFVLAASPVVGTAPVFVTTADVNGDGRRDLISANSGGNTVSVVLNSLIFGASFSGNGGGLTNIIASSVVGTFDASKITSGTFATSLIPGLDGSKIISGTVADARLSSNIPRLNGNNEFSGINGLNDNDLHFRGSADGNHGIGWYGTTGPVKTFAGFGPDGCILYGFQGGGLGTVIGGQRLALMWNSSGNVGIGKTNPASILDVNGTVSALAFSGDGSALTSLNVSNLSGTVADTQLSTNVALLYGTNVFTQTNQFTGVVIATNVNNQLVGSFTGNGIGVTNLPATNLAGVLTLAQIPSLDATNITSGTFVDARLTANVALLNRSIQSFTGGTNSFSGNVGIGTAAPGVALDISRSTAAQGDTASLRVSTVSGDAAGPNVRLAHNGTGGRKYGIWSTGSGNIGGPGLLQFADETAGASRMVINATGYVGIGTANPDRPLTIGAYNSGNGEWISFKSTNDTTVWHLNNSFGGLDFVQSGVADYRLFLSTNGNVGIGTNAPQQKLHVAGNLLASGSVSAASFAGDGSGLTNLANVPLLTSANVFTATNRFAGIVIETNVNNQFVGSFTGNGGGLTNLYPTNLNSALAINTTVKFAGDRTNGIANSVVLLQNTNTSTAAAPALRVQNDGGTTPNGALSVSANVSPTAPNSVIAQFGNVSSFVVTITNDGTIYSKGVALTSDRNAKESFQTVDGKLILEKVASLPMSEWDYKDTPGIRHLGPMAQDFHAAFGLNGNDEHHISVVDEGGVALAAIQGLNEKVEARSEKAEERIKELGAELKRRDLENANLRARLEKIETLLNQQLNGGVK